MRWNRPVSGVGPGQSRLVIVTVIVVAVMIPVLLSVGAGDQKRISIYSGSANYTLNVQDRDGKEYVDLLEILQPLGATSIRSDRSSWRLRFGNAESEFIPEKARARIRGSDFDLPGKFKLENGRGLVPLASLSTLLPQFLGAPVAFRESFRPFCRASEPSESAEPGDGVQLPREPNDRYRARQAADDLYA